MINSLVPKYFWLNNLFHHLASRSQRAGVENAEALPNPWGNATNTSGSASTNTGAGSGASSQPSANLLAGKFISLL